MPVGALVEAGALFGIPGNAIRVALARLLAAGRVVRDERGRYRLGATAEPALRRVRSWRDFDRATRAWTGSWLAVHPVAAPVARRRADDRTRGRAMRFFGFRRLEAGLWVRPDNLRAGPEGLRQELRALGLPPGDLVFVVSGLDASTDARARTLWDATRLRTAHRERLAALEASERRLAALPAERAMVESFLLGRAIIRDLVLDPLLPEAICPGAERQALVTAVRRYDRLGRAAWAGFLRRFDVPHVGMPLDGPRRMAV